MTHLSAAPSTRPRLSLLVATLLVLLGVSAAPAWGQTPSSGAVASGSGVASSVVFEAIDVASSVLLQGDRRASAAATQPVVSRPGDAIDAAAIAAAEAESAAWAEELLAQGAAAQNAEAGSTSAASETPAAMRSLSVLFLGAGLVVLAGFALLRYRKGAKPEAGKYLEVIQTLRIDAKHQLAAVQVPSGILVLSIDDKETKVVAQLEPRAAEPGGRVELPMDRAAATFASVQREVLRKALETPVANHPAIAPNAAANQTPRGGSFFDPPALPPVRKRTAPEAVATRRPSDEMEAERAQLRARAQRRTGSPAVNTELERVRRELEQLRSAAN